jgi:tRNA-dihydrouridine synthase A
VINGGISSWREIDAHLEQVDGVMLGRVAITTPGFSHRPGDNAATSVRAMHDYAQKERTSGTALRHITRHMLGLYHGHRRARLWRRMLSDPARLSANDPRLLLDVCDAVEAEAVFAAAA